VTAPVAELLIGDIFRAGARAVPNRVAAAMGDRSLTFAEMNAAANTHARAISELGVAYGDRVVLWSNTSLDAVPVFAAVAKLGAVFAPANAILGVDEAAEMAGLARPSLLVVDDDHAADGKEIANRLGIPVAVLGRIVPDDPPDPGEPPEPPLRETDPHVVFFTSGTSGRSKGVVLSHRVNYLRSHPGSQLEPRGTNVCMYPLFHMGAWTIALTSWQHQAAVVFVPQADPVVLVNEIERWRATHFNAIPAVWRRILDLAREDASVADRLSSLRIADSGTSATPPDLLLAIHELVPNAVRRVFYGSTEAGAVCLLRDEAMEAKPGACGVPQHSCRTRLDPETGELQVSGALLFDGYFDNPEATADAMTDDGWFRTGDVAAIDDDGFYAIVGRVKDVIRTGGETVAPVEVELALADHPALIDVAVVGIPDAQWGEIVCAAVVVRDGEAAPDVEALRTYVGDRLARFKHPRMVVVLDAVPRTPATRQVQRRLIIEQVTSTPGS